MILTFVSEDEPRDAWDTGEGWLASLVPVRAELARGDLRALYLGWLLCAQNGEVASKRKEPPVPAGLSDLSASLRSLAEFLRIDGHLLAAAAATGGNVAEESLDRKSITRWVAALPLREKDNLLATLMSGEGPHIGNELLQRFRRERTASVPARAKRSVGELLRGAADRKRIAADKAAEESVRREREAKVARAQFLDGLAGRQPRLWAKVERLIATKQPAKYDDAVKVLVDLRDLADRKGQRSFRRRIESLRATHVRKSTLISKMKEAGL